MRVLHLHSSFHAGGKELRAAKLINAFGPVLRHAIVSAVPGALGAAGAIDPAMRVEYPADFPPMSGRPSPARLRALAAAPGVRLEIVSGRDRGTQQRRQRR